MGDESEDAGLTSTLALSPEFACGTSFAEVAREQQSRHFPSLTSVPAAPASREIVAGDGASRQALVKVMERAKGKEALLLNQFGAALHSMQDSWAHRGPVATLTSFGPLKCDPQIWSLHGPLVGGPYSHDADLTKSSPESLLAAARVTFPRKTWTDQN